MQNKVFLKKEFLEDKRWLQIFSRQISINTTSATLHHVLCYIVCGRTLSNFRRRIKKKSSVMSPPTPIPPKKVPDQQNFSSGDTNFIDL